MEVFNGYLRKLGWTRARVAHELHLHRNTVSRWKHPPGYAMAYLRLMLDIRDDVREMSRRYEVSK